MLAYIGAAFFARGALSDSGRAPKYHPLIGALRWDAWYTPGSTPTEAVRRSLAPEKYHWRLPFFAKLNSEQEPTFPTLTQAELDLEIQQAIYAGLDYWAFVAYPKDDPMSAALLRYLDSQKKQQLKFCLFTEVNRWGTQGKPTPLIDEHIELMKRPEYVKVSGERPLYYLGFIDRNDVVSRWGGAEGLKTQINDFRTECTKSGVGNPYIVLAGSSSQIEFWSSLGGDAIGAYTISDPRGTGDYDSLTRIVEQRWRSMTRYHLPVVPTVVTGWDRRPRVERPVPWERGQHAGAGINYFFESPRSDQIAAQLDMAIKFTNEQPDQLRAPALLIYAWNENDEGGWLVPTLPCNSERIDALHRMLALQPGASTSPGCKIMQQ
ncbi:hypothetical protein SSBR45G_16450 [Bradyrhizobium sp. SSBR45G]|nr:hypothetical protein SSBR45G_16450 [Bradyrhizobium sp. SSBR45G]GLH83495.1 hypothetical protein SSBR45R_09550 [Bradyrhizobium sp. SSBR45R]